MSSEWRPRTISLWEVTKCQRSVRSLRNAARPLGTVCVAALFYAYLSVCSAGAADATTCLGTRLYVRVGGAAGQKLELYCGDGGKPVSSSDVPAGGPILSMTSDWRGRILELDRSERSEFEGSVDRYDGAWQGSGSISDSPLALAVDKKRHKIYLELVRDYKTSDAQVEVTAVDDRTLRPTGGPWVLGRISIWRKMMIDAAGNLAYMASNDMNFGVFDSKMQRRFTAPGIASAITSGRDGLTYVVDGDARISAYDPRTYHALYSTKLAAESIVADYPSQIAADSKGRIYLANNRTHSLGLYLPRAAIAIASRSIGTIADIAIDKEDNVYAIEWPLTSGHDGYFVTVFKAGTLKPIKRYEFNRDNVPFAITIVE